MRQWREAHRPQHLAISKKCWAKNKDRYNLDRKLGGPSLYQQMFKKQRGRCAICRKPETSQRYKTLTVDHCHSTGKIRGLLCSNCNRGLGLFREKVRVLRRAANYLCYT